MFNLSYGAIERGIERGYSLGMDNLSQLNAKLFEAGRDDDVKRATTDVAYRKQLLEEFEITN